jgi:outer membrane protein assembly factor BamB
MALPMTRIFKTVLVLLAALAAAAALIFGVFGGRLDFDGSGRPAQVHFDAPEDHDKKLEASRAQAPPEPAPAPVLLPVAASTPPPEPAPTPAVPYWTDFRGPRRDGHYTQTNILTAWPNGKLQPLWKQPIGGGWASFVIAGGLAFTIEQRKTQEVIAAYDAATGRERWTQRYDADFQESMGGPGPRATPTWHDGKLYSLGAEGHLIVLDAPTGKLLWQKNILDDNNAENLTWAMSASPLIVDDLVIVQPGGPQNKSIVAYHKLTGAKAWGSLSEKAAYASPVLATLNGQRQILTMTATRAVALDPATGKLLWEYPWKTDYDVNSSSPIVAGPNRVVLASGYGHGAALVEIAPGGAVKTIWQNTKLKTKFSTAVLHQGYLYGLDDAILACVDAATGEQKWKGGRYGYGQFLLASGHLVITTEQGDLALVKATPAGHEELARFPALDGKTWNVPAIADGRLFVRNTREMAAFQLGAP